MHVRADRCRAAAVVGRRGMTVPLHNGEIAQLLLQAAAGQDGHRKIALERASKEAWRWAEEAADVAASGRPLTTLRSVGPWVAEQMEAWLEQPPPVPEPGPTRQNFPPFPPGAGAPGAHPTWPPAPHAALQGP